MRAGLFVAACVVLLLSVGAATEWSLGERSMRESDLAIARGQTRHAAVAARRAAEAVVPGSPYPARGYARLEAIAMAGEVERRPEDAAFAWRAMRSAAVATRQTDAARGKVLLADEGILRTARSSVADSPGGVPSAPEGILRAELAERP